MEAKISDFLPYLTGFRPGSVLAGYRLEALVGAGGMAVVFRARDERLDRPVALKILDPSRAAGADPAFRERFIAESRAAAKVDHPNIVPVYEADEADGVPFIAMRFVHGGDLGAMLERTGTLPLERAARLVSAVASALDAAHEAGLVHRDVKPANILVDTRAGRDHVYLSDFGIAKAAVAAAAQLTQPGYVMGTADYLAPEHIAGGVVDGRADQYALGCVAYQLLTGIPPFRRADIHSVLGAHLHVPPPSLTSQRPDLPPAADAVMGTVLAKAPGERFGSCVDFADALREALGLAPYRRRESATAPAAPPHTAPPHPAPPHPAPVPPAQVQPATPRTAQVQTAPPRTAPVPPATPRTAPVTQPSSAAAPAMSGTGPGPHAEQTVTDIRLPVPAAASGGPEPPPARPEPEKSRWTSRGRGRPAAKLPRARASRRGKGWRAARAGVPLVVLAAAVSVILVALTSHAGTSGAMNAAGLESTGCGSAFGGYPGVPGAVTVSSIASSGGTRLAVGSSGGRPAIWRCAGGGWQLEPATAAAALRGAGAFSSVTHGPAGWIAAGNAGSGAPGQPLAVTSANGLSWRPLDSMAAFTGPGSCVSGVAAGKNEYAVVGSHTSGSRIFAAMWRTADLRSWAEGNNDRFGFLDGSQSASAVEAVAATPDGFVAAGTHGEGAVIWTSADGSQWTLMSGTGVPAGALYLVAVSGTRVAAAGYTVTPGGGDAPVVVISTDGGLHWEPPIVLRPSGAQGGSQDEGRVTALAATGSGFAAAGTIGAGDAQRAVTWRSADGITWSKATPAARGTSGVTALSASGRSVTGASPACGPA